jgi:hypothetical protein
MNSGDDVEYRSLDRTGWRPMKTPMAALHKAVDCGVNGLRSTSIGFEMPDKNTTVSISSLNDTQAMVGIRGATVICGRKARSRHSRVGGALVSTPGWAFEA